MKRTLNTVLRMLIALLILWGSLMMIRITIPYAAFNRYTDFLMTKQLVYANTAWRLSFYTHVLFSFIVLFTGLFQFNKWLLQHRPRFHRWCGKVYIIVVIFFSGPSGLVMSFYANYGRWPGISFGILAVLWMLFTAIAYLRIRQGKWLAHAQWMLLSFSLALSALTLRFYVMMIAMLHLPIHGKAAYILVAWLSWTLNLLVALVILRTNFLQRYAPAVKLNAQDI